MRSDRKIRQALVAIELWDKREKGMTEETKQKVSVIRSNIARNRTRNKNGQFNKPYVGI
jgi:hypothetical protein